MKATLLLLTLLILSYFLAPVLTTETNELLINSATIKSGLLVFMALSVLTTIVSIAHDKINKNKSK